jgi:hypothetical protein
LQLVDRAIAQLELDDRSGPLIRRRQDERGSQLQHRINIILFCEMRAAHERVAAATEELLGRLAASAPRHALIPRLEATLQRRPPRRRGQSVRQWAQQVEAHVQHACDVVINDWSDAERQILADAAAELTRAWPTRVADLFTPLVGPVRPLAAPVVRFPSPVVPLAPVRLRGKLLLPGRFGRWQVDRRQRRWMSQTIPVALEARRTAIDASVAAALQNAETQAQQQLGELADRLVTETPRHVSVTAASTHLHGLRKLRETLIVERHE